MIVVVIALVVLDRVLAIVLVLALATPLVVVDAPSFVIEIDTALATGLGLCSVLV